MKIYWANASPKQEYAYSVENSKEVKEAKAE